MIENPGTLRLVGPVHEVPPVITVAMRGDCPGAIRLPQSLAPGDTAVQNMKPGRPILNAQSVLADCGSHKPRDEPVSWVNDHMQSVISHWY